MNPIAINITPPKIIPMLIQSTFLITSSETNDKNSAATTIAVTPVPNVQEYTIQLKA
eukprot:CAMPEP_0168552186 /NCGR_PEP_ID=MMETSP0413-20121227/6581_1 /TAXON_ID=136452 /ORGANISM="Filamoeba nolandi, Strain NC-AS-23-1" /LENGTH=56 /DNA_ID=CAMNT_0008582781 /DNA_START=74 /DNA_END=240 /DNA_ORIENTATION=-